jgi:phosphopantothenoylcysteine decarboxylase/phosphopantothenate--cysteine ligase
MVLVVPATADLLSRMATGRADDLVSALVLSARGPVVVAPAMHPRMWAHPAVQANVRTLTSDAWRGLVHFIGPVAGVVASGEDGLGRMAEPDDIVAAASNVLLDKDVPSFELAARSDLAGARIVVTAGPTHEPIDPVRFIGNRSSGKMGFSIAERAASRGAAVTLIAGPVSLPTPRGVKRVDVHTAEELRVALDAALGASLDRADVLVMAAAVADSRPTEARAVKWKKGEMPVALPLTQNPDLLAAIGARRGEARRPLLVGFALETGDAAHVVAEAKRKRVAKRIDVIVANAADVALGGDATEVILVDGAREVPFGPSSKHVTADRLLDEIAALLQK